ncbi:MAG: type II secretion system F family protein [Planctomycetes bacterium]|nr:type II secretion system F family protein [Planctomycetota bacterium]
MAVFEYHAVDLDASEVTGTLIADTPRQARDSLRERGLTITRIVQSAETAGKLTYRQRRRGRHSQAEVVMFVRELATLLSAGIPLLSALQTLTEQHRRHFKAVLQHLSDRIATGESLADGLQKHPAYFDELCVSIVRVGESTGSLESSLVNLADFKEKAHRLRNRVGTALVYPAAVCVIGVAVSVFLMTYVVPNLLNTLEQAGRQLPAVTRIIKAGSYFLLHWWWLLLIGCAAAMMTAKAVLRTQKGRLAADRLLLRIPVLGDLIRKEITSRMAVVMAALLNSGLQFVQAVRITRRTMRNLVFCHAMDDYESAVTAGSDVAGPLRRSGVFSPLVVQMLAVGQKTGQLENMLEQLAVSYEQQVDTATQRLTALLEPVLIVCLAVFIGFIAFATILPILEASNVL